jgi:hypothetical protein
MTVPKTVQRIRAFDSKSQRLQQQQEQQEQEKQQRQEQQHASQTPPASVDVGLTWKTATEKYHNILTSIARDHISPIDGLDREVDKPDVSESIEQNQTPLKSVAMQSTSSLLGSEIDLVTCSSRGETSSLEQQAGSDIGIAK